MSIPEVNLHPILVHFPVALFISALGMEMVSWVTKKESFHRTAVHMYMIAAIVAIPAAYTGWLEIIEDHLNHPVVFLHRNLAFVTLGLAWLGILLLWLNRTQEAKSRQIFTVFVILTALCVGVAGYQGGRLVYEYGVGIAQKD